MLTKIEYGFKPTAKFKLYLPRRRSRQLRKPLLTGKQSGIQSGRGRLRGMDIKRERPTDKSKQTKDAVEILSQRERYDYQSWH